VGEGKAQFLGSLEGIMYVETAKGDMDEAFVRCPIVQDINLEDGTTSASGKCVIVVSPDDTAYAEKPAYAAASSGSRAAPAVYKGSADQES
jgi:hypothetical protein